MTHYLDLRAKNIAPTLSPLAKLKVLETLLADKNHGEAESLSLQIMDEVKSGGWQPHLLVMLADVCFKMVEMGHREPALALLLHLRTRAELPTGKREEWSVRCDKLQKAA